MESYSINIYPQIIWKMIERTHARGGVQGDDGDSGHKTYVQFKWRSNGAINTQQRQKNKTISIKLNGIELNWTVKTK